MLSVGELLRREREKQGKSLRDLEKTTRVREKVLRAVEENEWNSFTSKVYITGAIKGYASALGLDPDNMLAYFRRDYEKKDDLKFKKNLPTDNLLPETKKLVIGMVVSIFLLFTAYFGYQLKLYTTPPKVEIVLPTESTFRNVERIRVRGQTEKEANITIFGERVYQRKGDEGIFEYDFPMRKGKNTLTIEVIGANGKKTIVTKDYILE